ncbi:hypothetical protein GGX14DRAFT_373057 [Mycena pura]|uniref:ubiquitinyl hydrolase 1 n=1 Tax=Mycena pura TaxID=153505 RepID=A0AAD6V049_9AGAR|nr:hypothetical protein GGX14DRAFT_373057 [Mycena pura]
MPPKYPQSYQHQQPYVYGPPPPPAVAGRTPPHQLLSPLPEDLLSPLHDETPALVTLTTPPYYPTPPPDLSPLPQPSLLPELPSAAVPLRADYDTAAEPTAPPPAPQLPPASEPSLSLSVSHEQVDALSASSSSTFLSPSTSSIGSSASGTSSARPSGAGGWAIWSRRPLNPAHAPGIIISSRAHPPLDVLSHALDERTPPASPVLQAAADLQAEDDVDGKDQHRVEEDEEAWLQAEGGKDGQGAERETETPSSNASVTDITDATGARTPTTAATTIPSSPVSISASTSAPGAPKAPADSSPVASPPTDETAFAAASPSTSAPPSVFQDTAPAATAATSASARPSVPQDSPAPSSSVKSWASLLRAPASPASPSASGPATGAAPRPKWSGLPTSSVVGFSIPASAPPPPAEHGPVNRAALLALLAGAAAPPTTAPANFAAAAAARADAKTQAPTRIAARGLINTGNMCFANAVLQVLVYCPAFVGLFARLQALLGEEGDGGGESEGAVLGAAPLVRATGAFLREFVRPVAAVGGSGKGKGKAEASEEDDEEEEAFIPTGVYDALKEKKRFDHMRGGHQEDAEEFLGFYLDTLEEELLAVAATLRGGETKGGSGVGAVVEEREEAAPTGEEDGWLEVGKKNRTVVTRTIKTAESPITHIFGGKFRSTLRAPGQKDSVIVEDWRSLRLDIQRDGIHTIQDALALISQPQSVQMTNPSRPGVVVEASQQVLIEALPSVLVLHIKRFCYDTTVGGVVKVGKQIAFTPELIIESDVMAPTTTARKPGPVRYKLFGAVYHHGVSASGGHYTLDVLHPTRSAVGEGWVRIDDELVSDVRPMDVFGAAVAGRDDTRCAYLLFYRQIR